MRQCSKSVKRGPRERIRESSSILGQVRDQNTQREKSMAEEKKVEITLKTIGPARPSSLTVSPLTKVRDLRSVVAEIKNLPVEQLKLILRGEVLHDIEDGDDVHLRLKDKDTILVAVKPKSPAQHIRDDFDDDDEDDLKFEIPRSTGRWKRKLFSFLHYKLKFPNILLTAIFSISLKAWAVIILWFMLAPVAYKWELGPLYILGTGFSIILLNLGKREDGELSAYSLFNEDFRELPGTLNADRLDRDIRAGQF